MEMRKRTGSSVVHLLNVRKRHHQGNDEGLCSGRPRHAFPLIPNSAMSPLQARGSPYSAHCLPTLRPPPLQSFGKLTQLRYCHSQCTPVEPLRADAGRWRPGTCGPWLPPQQKRKALLQSLKEVMVKVPSTFRFPIATWPGILLRSVWHYPLLPPKTRTTPEPSF